MLAEWVRRPRLCLASTVPGGLGSPSALTTEGRPSMGWTGQDERSESSVIGPAKSRPSESRKPRSRSPKSPRWSAARRCALRKGRGRRKASVKRQRLAALRPLTSGARTEGATGASQPVPVGDLPRLKFRDAPRFVTFAPR